MATPTASLPGSSEQNVSTPASSKALLNHASQYAHWLPRVALASVFIFHGINKLGDVAGFGAAFSLPTPVAWMVALGEIGAGIGIIAGAFTKDLVTRVSGALMAIIMAGAIFGVHWGGWDVFAAGPNGAPGMEFNVTLASVGLFFALRGNGRV